MILSDKELRPLCMGDLVVPTMEQVGEGPEAWALWADEYIQPCSVEVTLHPEFLYLLYGSGQLFDAPPWGGEAEAPEWEYYEGIFNPERGTSVEPGEFILASTQEEVNIPNDLVGFVHGKSSLARKGLLIHVTAGLLDPGFSGQITLELKNVSPEPLILHAGMKIAQLTFQALTSPAERPYGDKTRGSHYQNQAGPTRSRG